MTTSITHESFFVHEHHFIGLVRNNVMSIFSIYSSMNIMDKLMIQLVVSLFFFILKSFWTAWYAKSYSLCFGIVFVLDNSLKAVDISCFWNFMIIVFVEQTVLPILKCELHDWHSNGETYCVERSGLLMFAVFTVPHEIILHP